MRTETRRLHELETRKLYRFDELTEEFQREALTKLRKENERRLARGEPLWWDIGAFDHTVIDEICYNEFRFGWEFTEDGELA